MTKEEHIDYWLKTAEHDWDTASHLFETERYGWCLFISHLVIEKALKAFWVKDSEKRVPRHDNLLKLAQGTRLSLSKEQKQFLSAISPFKLEAAYRDYNLELGKFFTKDFTTPQFKKIKDFYLWLLSQMRAEPAAARG